MSNEAIILNSSNLTTPDTYELGEKPIYGPREVTVKGVVLFTLPFKKKIGVQQVMRIKRMKKEIIIDDENVWGRARILASRGYPVFLYENEKGDIKPAPLKKRDGDNTKVMMNSDRWLGFKKNIKDLHKMTERRWQKFERVAVVVILGILATAIVIVSFVLYSKFGLDHTTVLKGSQNMTNTILNRTTSYIQA